MKLKIKLLLVLMLYFALNGYTQQDTVQQDSMVSSITGTGTTMEMLDPGMVADKFNNIIPPSPVVAQFQKYIDYPVSHCTGIADISIPLYEIHTGDLSLPISLSYHSSGFKVDDQSGIVGLGWVLNAGGMISRQIVNKPDEFAHYPYPYKDVYSLNQENEADFFYLGNMNNGGGSYFEGPDGEYDIFYYNIGSVSGKFILAGNGNNKRKPVVIPFEPVTIKSNSPDFNSNIEYFEIKDKIGNTYRFGKSSVDGTMSLEVNNGNSFTTAWFLKEIYSADRSQSIKFKYEPKVRYQTHRSDVWEYKDYLEQHQIYTSPIDDECSNALNSILYSIFNNQIEQTNTEYRSCNIKEIQFTGGLIEFNYNNSESLKDMIVTNKTGTIIKKVVFEQELFSNLPVHSQSYFKLSSLRTIDSYNNENEKYDFFYNESTNFPLYEVLYNTTGVDFWGYYNGKTNNSSLIPPFELSTDYGSTVSTSSNNREADEISMQTFILTKIKYPTGGTTEFKYETNRANNKNVGGLRVQKIISKSDENVKPLIKRYVYGNQGDEMGMLLQDPYNINNYITLSSYDFICPLYQNVIGARFRVRTVSSDINDGSSLNSGNPVFYSEVTEYVEDLNGVTNGKSVFEYEPPNISNYLIGTNTFTYNYDEWKTNHLMSKTDYMKEGNIYYPIRKEKYDYYIRMGQPLKCTKVMIKKYGVDSPSSSWSWYNPSNTSIMANCCSRLYDNNIPQNNSSGCVYNYAEYEYQVGVKLLESKITTTYFGEDSITTTESYSYGIEHNEPLSVTTENSNGKSKMIINKYPHDYSNIENMLALRDSNIISRPIDTRIYYNSRLISGAQTRYNNYGQSTDFYNFESTLSDIPFSASNPFTFQHKQTITYNATDKKPVKVSLDDNLKTYYVWAYNKQYPVAKIESNNANIDIVSIQNNINNLSLSGNDNKPQLDSDISNIKNAISSGVISANFVTIYTYKPLVGMTSETDPAGRTTYYEYDSFGRLKLVRDQNNNIVSKNEYHYANP